MRREIAAREDEAAMRPDGEMGVMQTTGHNRKRDAATRARRVSLDLTDGDFDRKLLEAMERIERLRSKATVAVGSLLAADE